jgi:PKHD-type hydroxylase
MILCIGNVLAADELSALRAALAGVRFVDGRATAGWHAALVKRNTQAERVPAVTALQQQVLSALARNPVFQMGARPLRIAPPLFSRYQPGMEYGRHVDDAVMQGEPAVRTDVAMTLFLSDPTEYDGGELVVESSAGEEAYKLEAGSAIVYPASSLHRVAPVTRGERLACVSWIQSQVRDPARRELLFELDTARRSLFEREGKSEEFDLISKSLANLLRLWVEV